MSCGLRPVRSRTALTSRSGTCGLSRLLGTNDVTAIGTVFRLGKLGVLGRCTPLAALLAARRGRPRRGVDGPQLRGQAVRLQVGVRSGHELGPAGRGYAAGRARRGALS